MSAMITRTSAVATLAFGLVITLYLLAPAGAAEPCCVIIAIDAATGKVTAKEGGSGRTFQFETSDKAVLKALRVGQKLHADFAGRKVTIDIDSAKSSGTILGPRSAETPAGQSPHLPEPCCEVTAVDHSTSVITARWRTTKRIVKFRMATTRLLERFHTGQAVDVADAGRGRVAVRIAGFETLAAVRIKE